MAGRSFTITHPAIRASLILLAALAGGACNRPAPDGVALVGATIWDGVSTRPQPGVTIIVRNDQIEAIGHPKILLVGACERAQLGAPTQALGCARGMISKQHRDASGPRTLP